MSMTGISPLATNATTATNPTASTASAAATTTTSRSASTPGNSLLNPNQFLSLLVDSLKYQDPLNPTSSANFLQQLASLSQVQTENQVAQTDQTSAAANLIGHTITGTGASGASVTGVVTGFTMTVSGPDLQVGNDTVSLGAISTVGPGSSATTAPTSSTTTPTSSATTGTSAS